MNLQWLDHFNVYAAESEEGGDLHQQNYRVLPWWKLAVRENSKEGWSYVSGLTSAPNAYRRCIKRLMTRVASFPLFRSTMQKQTIKIGKTHSWDLLFYGRGRHKVSFVDFNGNRVLWLSRNELSNKNLLQEIAVRKDYSQLFNLPHLYKQDSQGRFYEEEWLNAKPLETLSDSMIRNCEQEIFRQLIHYYQAKGYQKVGTHDYLSQILQAIHLRYEKLETKYQKCISPPLLAQLGSQIEKNMGESVNLTSVHGDLHMGNVLVKEEKPYVLDWENGDIKVQYYDWFNWRVVGRKSFSLGAVSSSLTAQPSKDELTRYPDFLRDLTKNSEEYYAIYLLERILFELEDPEPKLTWLKGWGQDLIQWMNRK